MSDDRSDGRGSTRAGFGVLLVAIKRERLIFTLSTLGSLLFGALTVADAWVLGWSTDHVVLPAFRDGEIGAEPADRGAGAVPGRRDPARGRHRRPPARGRDHAVPHAGPDPPGGHPPVPRAADGVAPAAPDRRAALQRQLRRGGGLGADRAAADGRRHGRDDGDRGRADAVRRPGAGGRRAAGVPGGDRHQRHLPAAGAGLGDAGPAAARRGQRDRARVVRRRHGGQDAGPRAGGDRAVRRQGPPPARRQHQGRPDPGGVRPHAGRAAQHRRADRARRRRLPRAQRSHRRRATWSPSPTCSRSSRSRSGPSAGCSASSRAAWSATAGCGRCSTRPARCGSATPRRPTPPAASRWAWTTSPTATSTTSGCSST